MRKCHRCTIQRPRPLYFPRGRRLFFKHTNTPNFKGPVCSSGSFHFTTRLTHAARMKPFSSPTSSRCIFQSLPSGNKSRRKRRKKTYRCSLFISYQSAEVLANSVIVPEPNEKKKKKSANPHKCIPFDCSDYHIHLNHSRCSFAQCKKNEKDAMS